MQATWCLSSYASFLRRPLSCSMHCSVGPARHDLHEGTGLLQGAADPEPWARCPRTGQTGPRSCPWNNLPGIVHWQYSALLKSRDPPYHRCAGSTRCGRGDPRSHRDRHAGEPGQYRCETLRYHAHPRREDGCACTGRRVKQQKEPYLGLRTRRGMASVFVLMSACDI